jgi:hypothetical protein
MKNNTYNLWSKTSANETIEAIQKFSGFKLKRMEDIQALLKICSTSEKQNLFEELIFTAKYAAGLKRVLTEAPMNPEVKGIESLQSDYTENLKKLINQLKELIRNTDESFSSRFAETYLELTKLSVQNLNELISDFDWTKMYFNAVKRGEIEW